MSELIKSAAAWVVGALPAAVAFKLAVRVGWYGRNGYFRFKARDIVGLKPSASRGLAQSLAGLDVGRWCIIGQKAKSDVGDFYTIRNLIAAQAQEVPKAHIEAFCRPIFVRADTKTAPACTAH